MFSEARNYVRNSCQDNITSTSMQTDDMETFEWSVGNENEIQVA